MARSPTRLKASPSTGDITAEAPFRDKTAT